MLLEHCLPIHLHTAVHGHFCTPQQSSEVVTEARWPAEPKVFTIWYFTEKKKKIQTPDLESERVLRGAVCDLWVPAPQIGVAASSRMSAFSFRSQEQCFPVFLAWNTRPTPSSRCQPCVPTGALVAGEPVVPTLPHWRCFCTVGLSSQLVGRNGLLVCCTALSR